MTLTVLISIAAIVIAAAAIIITRRRSAAEPSGWTAVTAGNSYGAVVDPVTGSFDFPVGDPLQVATLPVSKRPGIHYETRLCGKGELAGKTQIRLKYRITADPGVEFHPSSSPTQLSSIGPTLYLQRRGDDWSGSGPYDGYRWWQPGAWAAAPISPGEHTVTASLSDNWTGVESYCAVDHPEAFEDAIKNAERIGFVFGGGTGLGHGVFTTGKAHFELLGFDII